MNIIQDNLVFNIMQQSASCILTKVNDTLSYEYITYTLSYNIGVSGFKTDETEFASSSIKIKLEYSIDNGLSWMPITVIHNRNSFSMKGITITGYSMFTRIPIRKIMFRIIPYTYDIKDLTRPIIYGTTIEKTVDIKYTSELGIATANNAPTDIPDFTFTPSMTTLGLNGNLIISDLSTDADSDNLIYEIQLGTTTNSVLEWLEGCEYIQFGKLNIGSNNIFIPHRFIYSNGGYLTHIRIRAFDGISYSGWTEKTITSITLANVDPNIPSITASTPIHMLPSNETNYKISLSIPNGDDMNKDVLTYELEYSYDGNTYYMYSTDAGGIYEFDMSTVYTKVWYRVRVFDGFSYSKYAIANVEVILNSPPTAPTFIIVNDGKSVQ